MVAAPPQPPQFAKRFAAGPTPPPTTANGRRTPTPPAAGSGGNGCEENKTIWVGDLQYWMDENYLHNCFGPSGEVCVLSGSWLFPYWISWIQLDASHFPVLIYLFILRLV
jgi:hypothetical protein